MTESTEKQPGKEIQDTPGRAANLETAPAPRREYRMLVLQAALIAAVLAFAGLTFLVEMTPSFPIDLEITRALQSIDLPLFEAAMWLISWPGFPPQSYVLSSLVVVFAYLLGFQWEAIVTAVAAVSSSVVNVLVKQLIGRPRPDIALVEVFQTLESYSFPSGHVMFYAGFFGFLWFLVYSLFQDSIWRTTLLAFLGSLVALVGVSRIYLGQHWASDVLGAYLLGGLVLVGIIFLYRWGKHRFFIQQPVARPDPADVKRKPDRE